MDFDKLVEDLKRIQFPSIVNVTVDYDDVEYGIDVSIYCLGVCNTLEIAIDRAKEMEKVIDNKSNIYYCDVNETPIDGMGYAGGAYYTE